MQVGRRYCARALCLALATLTPLASGAWGQERVHPQQAPLGTAKSAPIQQASVKPLIMIDPGHGGIDPGAIGKSKMPEKTVVLAVATQLARTLEATKRYRVRLTRSTDIFVPLDIRLDLAKHAEPDIFISLHADTIDDSRVASQIHGASVYVLSEKASNEEARLMAEKENAVDDLMGTPRARDGEPEDVKPILFDLTARETATLSKLMSRCIVEALSKKHTLTREPERAAAFRVLRQPSAPAVLIELGFLSNATEEQLMMQPDWHQQIASALSHAIDVYFSQKDSAALGIGSSHSGGLPP